MSNKDLALIFITSIVGLVFVTFRVMAKVLFEWYILHALLLAGITFLTIRLVFACLS